MTSIHNFVNIDYLFRGKEHTVMCYVDQINVLKIEIEEKSTNLEWIASFTSEYIEELTKKTGNFKSFDVFTAMLQTVLTQNSDSLSLDLMSYSDLEELRKLKLGSLSVNKPSLAVNNDVNRSQKRYLILTYTTDFDKIHYPLPMTFQGVPDVKTLRVTISELRRQIYSSSNQVGSNYEKYELSELQKKIIQLKTENDELVSTIQKYKNHFQTSESSDDLKKELKAIKSIVRTLEEELTEEKSKHQRFLMRKNRENKTLLDEVSELKASKRNLNFRLHSLTNELAMFKRQRGKNGFTSPRPPICPPTKSSFDLLVSSSKMLSKSRRTSSPQMFSDPETARTSHKSRRAMTFSAPDRINRNSRRCLSADRYNTSSPSFLKFNPTAYIEQQKLKRKEIEDKKKRELRNRFNSSNLSDYSRDSSPSSYRNTHITMPNNYKSNVLSSSNASSLSNLDEKVFSKKSKVKQTYNKNGFEHRPAGPLNAETDDEISENDSACKYGQKVSNGFKSDDSSATAQGDCRNKTSKKKIMRRHLLDSEDDGSNIPKNRNRKPHINIKKGEFTKSRNSRVQQNNSNNLSYDNQSEDIHDIDRRLNALQNFFQKYLNND